VVGRDVGYFITGLALTPAALAGRLILMAVGVAAWFGVELISAGHQVGLAERALDGTQALWPLAVVLTARRGTGYHRLLWNP
jgi:hypothetical protein